MLACPRCRATYPDDLAECPEDGSPLLPSDMLGTLDPPLEAGTMVGEYRVERKLGAGTFGEVYAGEQPLIGKRVAIKLLHRKLSSDAEVVSRFVAEARAVNRIRHRHIIDIFSFGLTGDKRHYFVMELLDGLTLRDLLDRERRLPLDVALPIFRGIADALDAAHEAGVTHRDLKPDNVFLAVERDGSYFPKLLDFGIAKLLGEDVAHRTATGMAMGTPRYMSPEQCRGKKVDHHADIYSLGVVVHEALTGRPLFDADSTMDVLFMHTSELPPSMSSVSPDLPPELDGPVLAMVAKRPKDRPATAGEAIAALIRRARDLGVVGLSSSGESSGRDLRSSDARLPSSQPRLPSPGARVASPEPRHGSDDATVRVRHATPGTPVTPLAPGAAIAKEAWDHATIEVSSADLERSVPVPVSIVTEVSTEIAPVANASGTLLGEPSSAAIAGPVEATLRSSGTPSGDVAAAALPPETAPSRGAAIAPVPAPVAGPARDVRQSLPRDVRQSLPRDVRPSLPRGAGFWAVIVIAAAGAIGAVIALARPGAPPAAATSTPVIHAAPSGAPSSLIAETKVTADPAPSAETTATTTASARASSASSTSPAPPPTSPTSGKPVAKTKVYPKELEPPPP